MNPLHLKNKMAQESLELMLKNEPIEAALAKVEALTDAEDELAKAQLALFRLLFERVRYR